MACGCNKNRNSVSRGAAIRPGIYNRSSVGTLSAPAQVRSLAVTPTQPKNEGGTNAAKRKVQALRREAILKAFGK